MGQRFEEPVFPNQKARNPKQEEISPKRQRGKPVARLVYASG
jgi:hypothetical protein